MSLVLIDTPPFFKNFAALIKVEFYDSPEYVKFDDFSNCIKTSHYV